ncbi:hypothetical protein [Butyrivibrio sp. VCB2006]|uniref:hypothetical protein n=1 Tax=Butyrivibrio sp. VCB2006 TaxID=1280679 RepID=UPI000407FDD9|nr:hypothetical protein [Butyrivibrio sp. VCB2006]
MKNLYYALTDKRCFGGYHRIEQIEEIITASKRTIKFTEDANGEPVLKRHKVTVEPTIIKEPEERKEDSSRMSQKTCGNNMEVSDK